MVELPGESPARALLALAEREHADLIAVGSRRLGPLQRITVGSVSDAVLCDAPCAVAVPPRGYTRTPQPPRRIGAGWVPTSEADAALRFARALASATGGTLEVVTTVSIRSTMPTLGASAFLYEGFLEDMRGAAQRDVAAAVDALDGDVAVTVDSVIADTVEELVGRSAALDLLVLGSRAYGPLRRVVLGSVSFRVLREAECPVVVLPRGHGGAGEDDSS